MNSEAVAFLSFVTIVGGVALLLPVVRALAERIRPRGDVAGAAVRDELQALRDEVLEELRGMRREVGELGERVDFTERLLAKVREPGRIADGR